MYRGNCPCPGGGGGGGGDWGGLRGEWSADTTLGSTRASWTGCGSWTGGGGAPVERSWCSSCCSCSCWLLTSGSSAVTSSAHMTGGRLSLPTHRHRRAESGHRAGYCRHTDTGGWGQGTEPGTADTQTQTGGVRAQSRVLPAGTDVHIEDSRDNSTDIYYLLHIPAAHVYGLGTRK